MAYEEESLVWRTWKRRLLTFLVLLAALCLTLLPLWQTIGLQPMVLLIVVYYWTIHRPDLLTAEQLVLISLLQDGLYAYPLGFSALRLLVGYALLITQRRTLNHQRFLWIWGGFSVFCLVDALVYTILLSCVKQEWVGILPLLPGILITSSLYPLSVFTINYLVKKQLSC